MILSRLQSHSGLYSREAINRLKAFSSVTAYTTGAESAAARFF
jgi:hypothetical protein